MPLFRYLRRQWILRRPFPDGWEEELRGRLPWYRTLPEETRQKLQRRIRVFLAEKRFEGCAGLEVTDPMRLVIAAQACLLILENPSDYYPGLTSILVYPKDYVAPVYEQDHGGVVTEGWEPRSGESWSPGNIVLSWRDIRRDLRRGDGHNLVCHEFAHQLDYRYGLSSGIDPRGRTDSEEEWTTTLAAVYRMLRRNERRGTRDVLDPYGAVSPAEFFAVATESFIERPRTLRDHYPRLYRQLEDFYGYDPVLVLSRES